MNAENKSVLIANPDANDAATLKDKLLSVSADVSVTLVKSGCACIEAIASNQHDLCFINVSFLDMDCFALLAKLKEQKAKQLFVLTSELYDADMVDKAKRLGVYDCILKPYAQEDMKRLLYRVEMQHTNFPVLIADDSRVTRRVIFKVLEESNFQLTLSEANSGKMAVALCKKIPFRFVFIDYSMPVMNGMEAAKKILSSTTDCSIVLITAHQDPELQEDAILAGLAGFLKKPFLPYDVDGILHPLLGLPLPNIYQEAFLRTLREDNAYDGIQDNFKDNYLMI